MSFFGDKLRMFAAMADQAAETGPSFDSPVAAGQFARLQNDLMKFQLAVKESVAILERKIAVIDERTDPLAGLAETFAAASPVELKPKRKRGAYKTKKKEKTQAIKRKRRTKAEMQADAGE